MASAAFVHYKTLVNERVFRFVEILLPRGVSNCRCISRAQEILDLDVLSCLLLQRPPHCDRLVNRPPSGLDVIHRMCYNLPGSLLPLALVVLAIAALHRQHEYLLHCFETWQTELHCPSLRSMVLASYASNAFCSMIQCVSCRTARRIVGIERSVHGALPGQSPGTLLRRFCCRRCCPFSPGELRRWCRGRRSKASSGLVVTLPGYCCVRIFARLSFVGH
mmetsp:Transcript_4853/g.8414  ORF Transcript_4853/g.8414 Transcript_4853/m.8414 type:complete len:220 (-) Transcript_4853:90-749(-)